MAIANADGSVIIDASLNTDGIKEGFKEVNKFAQMSANEQRRLAQSLSGIYRKQGLTQSEAQKKAWQELKNGTVAAEEYEEALKDVETQSEKTTVSTKKVGAEGKKSFDSLQASLKKIVSYFIGFQTVLQAIRFSGASAELATQTEASVQRLVDIYGSASDSVGDFIDANARALGMSKAAAASFSSVYGNLFSVWADQSTNAELTNRYLNMTAVVASKTGRTVEDVQERVRSGLLGNTEAIEDLGIFVNVKTIEMTDAFQRMANGKSWEQLDAYTQQQIRSMAILEQATAKYGDEVADTSATIRNQFNAAYQDFQNSWGTIVNQVLLPVLQTLTEIFNIATAGLNALSGRSGKILEDAETNADSSKETADNIKDQADNQKDLNDQMKKTLAGFDDIQILSAGAAETTQPPPDTGGGGTAPDGSAYEQEISSTLTAIMGIVALSLAAVGLILLFTGNIGWGVGFIIAGAATLTVTMASASEFGYDGIIQMLTTIMGVAGGALLALGIILLWIGGVVGKSIAIGMIIAGGALIVSSVVTQAAFSPNDIKAWLSLIMGVVGGALLALGIILCMAGSVHLGVGLIIAGASSLVTAFALNSNAVVNWIKGVWQAVQAFWNRYIAPVFTLEWWGDRFSVIGKAFSSTWNSIRAIFAKAINWIIDGLNKISFDVPDWVPVIGGKTFGFDIEKLEVPKLAQGAVIPPNREFLAVLGDNKRENEIVSPVSTMKQAFMEALVEMGGTGQTKREEHYYLNETELMSIMYKLVKGGERLSGENLISGGVY